LILRNYFICAINRSTLYSRPEIPYLNVLMMRHSRQGRKRNTDTMRAKVNHVKVMGS